MSSEKICSIDGCSNPASRVGLCNAHYLRLRRHGDPLGGGHFRNGDPIKFYKEVILNFDEDRCLLWPYGTVMGYGSLVIGGKTHGVHRLICEARHGPPPGPKYHASHNCGVRLCCAWRHLRWDTHKGNHSDRVRHDTHKRGERGWNTILTEGDVREIRMLENYLSREKIAVMFGVSSGTIACVIQRRTWAWLD